MAKRHNDDPEHEQLQSDLPTEPVARATPTPLTGETTRVLLTGDDRSVVTERYIPTEEYGFRIYVDGQHFEHVAEAADSGTWIYAPTR